MQAPLFLRNKVLRVLKSNGIEYEFISTREDDYHQLQDGAKIKILGVYHEVNSFITVTASDAASVQRKKSPMILTLLDDSVKKLKQGDKVSINSVDYKVSGILDIQNYGVVADISLEMEV